MVERGRLFSRPSALFRALNAPGTAKIPVRTREFESLLKALQQASKAG